jgi:hypothetical protein
MSVSTEKTQDKRKQAQAFIREYVQTTKSEKFATLRQIAEHEPHEVGNALDELSGVFHAVAAVFTGLASDASNFKDNLDLNEPAKTASLRDRVMARRNYAVTLRRLANEEPEELGAAISAVYEQLDEAAGGIEALAQRFGLPLATEDDPVLDQPQDDQLQDDLAGLHNDPEPPAAPPVADPRMAVAGKRKK